MEKIIMKVRSLRTKSGDLQLYAVDAPWTCQKINLSTEKKLPMVSAWTGFKNRQTLIDYQSHRQPCGRTYLLRRFVWGDKNIKNEKINTSDFKMNNPYTYIPCPYCFVGGQVTLAIKGVWFMAPHKKSQIINHKNVKAVTYGPPDRQKINGRWLGQWQGGKLQRILDEHTHDRTSSWRADYIKAHKEEAELWRRCCSTLPVPELFVL